MQYFEKSQPGRRVGVDACEYAYQFLRQRGQSDEARQWRDRANALQEEINKLVAAHANLLETDALVKALASG